MNSRMAMAAFAFGSLLQCASVQAICTDMSNAGASFVYGYRYLGPDCFKTLEEAEYAMHTDQTGGSLPLQTLAFTVPGDFYNSPRGASFLDYRPNGALSDHSSVLVGAPETATPRYSVYVAGWPRSTPSAACTTNTCSAGICSDIADQAACVQAEFDATWQSRGEYSWVRQGSAQVSNNIAGAPQQVTGSGQRTGSLIYRPPSSTSDSWGSKISIAAVQRGAAGVEASTNGLEATASSQWSWNLQRKDDITCQQGATVNGGATSSGNACQANFIKSTIAPAAPTQTSGGCGVGDPCFPANGNNQALEKGFRYGEIAFDLYYNSLRQNRPYSYIDRNWSHSFSKRVITEWSTDGHIRGADNNSPLSTSYVIVQDEIAHQEVFTPAPAGSGVFRSTSTLGNVLVYHPPAGGSPYFWELDREGGVVEIFDRTGRLTQIIHSDDPRKSLTLSYLGSPLPTVQIFNSSDIPSDEAFWRLGRVQDGTGRYVTFEYSNDQYLWLTNVIADDGTTVLMHFDFDAAHRLTKATFADLSYRQYLYNESGNIFVGGAIPPGITGYWLTGIKDEMGRRYGTYKYDDWGRVIANWHGSNAEKVTLSYSADAADSKATVTMPLGNQVTYSYSASEPYRRAESKIDTAGTWGYQYNPYNHRLAQTTDPNGNITKIEYDATGTRVTKRTEAFGRPEQRRIESDWDAASNRLQERRVYSQPNNGASVLESRATYAYDAATGRLQAKTETAPDTGMVRKWTYAYCASTNVGTGCVAGLLQSIDGPRTDVSDITTYAYFTSTDLSGCSSGPSGACHHAGDLASVKNALGQITSYMSYDRFSRLTRMKDVNGVITDLRYSVRGFLTDRIIRSNVSGVPSAGDAATHFDYDSSGLLTKTVDPDGAALNYAYDDAHRLVKITDGLNNVIDYCPGGQGSLYCLDAAGNRRVEHTKDAAGTLKRALGRTYNQLSQLVAVMNAAGNPVERSEGLIDAVTGVVDGYDRNGNKVLSQDGLGTKTKQSYDGLDRLVATIRDYLGSAAATSNTTSAYSYDARDNLRSVIDPEGYTTSYTYDGLSNLKALASPDTGTTNYTYDAAGNRIGQTDARGVTSAYSYDAINRLVKITYPTTSLNVVFAYDQANSATGCQLSYPQGRLTQMTDATGSTTYCYDHRGNVIRKIQLTTLTQSCNGSGCSGGSTSLTSGDIGAGVANPTKTTTQTLTTLYGYTSGDRLVSLQYPSGAIVSYGRDVQGRITSVKWQAGVGAPSTTIVSAVTYNPFGPVEAVTYGNGRTSAKYYDTDYAIQSIVNTDPEGWSADYDVNVMGNIKSANTVSYPIALASGPAPVSQPTRYDYDALYRLTAVWPKSGSNAPAQEAYTYSGSGDRLTARYGSEATQTYSYIQGTHRLAAVGRVARTYDANGNTTSNGLSYDDRNRLRGWNLSGGQINLSADSALYGYNGRGERVSKQTMQYAPCDPPSCFSIPGIPVGWLTGTVAYSYDEAGRLLSETPGPYSTSVGGDTIYLDAVPVALVQQGKIYAIETDHLGTPRVAFDLGTNVAVWYWNLESDAFGRQAPNGPLTFNFRFPGQYYDAETGLNYNKFRDYEASSARYVESDPIGLMGGINSYSYVKSSPMKYSDEFGLSGSAPVWNQDQWRDPSRRLWTNCWGYALNLPGQHGNPNNDKFYLGMNCSNLMAASKAAGLIDPTAGGDCGGDCPSGYYKVQVFADEGYLNPDMHFYRQDADGGWSHKRGALLPENRDSDDVPLTCPMNQASKYSDRTYKYCGTLCRRI